MSMSKAIADENSIAKRWRILHGEDNWNGLLDELDSDLRRYLIHYGDLAAANEAFNSEKLSKNYGSCRYSKEDLFANVGLELGNPFKYNVTKYLYSLALFPEPQTAVEDQPVAAPWSKHSYWIGYVAVSTDEGSAALGRRDIVVSFRGTVTKEDGATDFLAFSTVSAPEIFGANNEDPKVHSGWYYMYVASDTNTQKNNGSLRQQVLCEIEKLVEEYKNKNEEISITVVGHSMGAALATLNAVDIVFNGYNKPKIPVTAFLYASPRVGNSHFKEVFSKQENLKALKVRNLKDIVPELPPHEFIFDYSDVGEELRIDSTLSKYLKNEKVSITEIFNIPLIYPIPTTIYRTVHDLQEYLHGIAGTEGNKNKDGFDPTKAINTRDISLVNKYADSLKEEIGVLPSWLVVKNKGMVQQDDGSWELN